MGIPRSTSITSSSIQQHLAASSSWFLVFRNTFTMKITLALLALVLVDSAYSWGGRFNRFSPEMLSNLGYGAGYGYGNNRHAAQRFLPPSSMDLLESMLQSEEDEDDGDVSKSDTCTGRRCSANEHCCAGSVCVDIDGPSGTCLPHHGQREGTTCHRSSDCDVSLVCAAAEGGKTCQQPTDTKKSYNEECSVSSECDISKGLCCLKLRRHRQSPRKACSYFRDPMVCLGAVQPMDAIKDEIHHTANEKRLTGRAFNLPRD